jgi:opacity protein-like surface antigen
MRKIASLLNLLLFLLLFSIPALAQTKYRLEFYGAVDSPQNKDFQITLPQSTVLLTGTHEFSLGGRGGIRFGADGKKHWGQDFIYSYGSNASRIVNHTYATSFAFTNHIHQFSYNALWYPCGLDARKKVFPYLTTGVGGAFVSLNQKTIDAGVLAGLGQLKGESAFTFNAGGGIRVRVNDVYGFRIDVRDLISRPYRYGLPQASNNPSATVFPVSGIFQQFEVSFAFVYHFK